MIHLARAGHLLAWLAIFAAHLWPDSAAAEWLRGAGLTYLGLSFLLRVRAGYVRRRPHWTAESWRRYLMACSVPAAAIVLLAAMLIALDMRLPIVGAAESNRRSAFAAASLVLLLIGGGGLALATEWLERGDETRQFDYPVWLRLGGSSRAQ